MPISTKDVEKAANLAKLELSPEEKTNLQAELDGILGFIDQLTELDTGEVPAMSHVISVWNVLREDRVLPLLSGRQALPNAPRNKDGFFGVPRVMG
jgi:aspartyl-tRNA(Asn)/glutamyl-tRNA(Gln) amidotransferase subunit C